MYISMFDGLLKVLEITILSFKHSIYVLCKSYLVYVYKIICIIYIYINSMCDVTLLQKDILSMCTQQFDSTGALYPTFGPG